MFLETISVLETFVIALAYWQAGLSADRQVLQIFRETCPLFYARCFVGVPVLRCFLKRYPFGKHSLATGAYCGRSGSVRFRKPVFMLFWI